MPIKPKDCNKTDKSAVSSPPLTEAQFEQFLRKVTRPIQKPQDDQEKTQT